jgi:hypothetical protein
VQENGTQSLNRFILQQNFPNPFNMTTRISFSLQQKSAMRLSVYDLLGREVQTLLDETRDMGQHQILWGAKDLALGAYLLRLEADEESTTRR